MNNPDADSLIKQYDKFNQPIPDELIAPELHDVEYALWRAFWDLDTERSAAGMGVGRIRWSKIQERGKMLGIEQSAFERIIRAMDDAFMQHKNGSTEGKQAFSREMMKGK